MVATTRRFRFVFAGALAFLALTSVFLPIRVQAVPLIQETPSNEPPPAVGAVVLADPTFSMFGSYRCPTGRNIAEHVGEGYIVKVTGRCNEDSTIAAVFNNLDRTLVPDGEVRFDFKVVTGHDRARVNLGFRVQPDFKMYQAAVLPASGEAALYIPQATLAVRKDLGGSVSRDDWNTIAVRTRGTSIWILLNEQVVLQANDATYDSGTVAFSLSRLGDLNDTPETAAVFRNLRISSLAIGDAQRAPTLLPRPQT